MPEAAAFAPLKFITGPLLENPYRVGKRLLPPLEDRYSVRRGTYRVIYRIDDDARVVTVVDVGHRRDDLPHLTASYAPLGHPEGRLSSPTRCLTD